MKRTELIRRTPLAPGAPLNRSQPFDPARGLPRGPGYFRAAAGVSGRSDRKRASDAAMRKIRPLLLERAEGRCEITGVPLGHIWHAHHRVGRGGPERDTLANLLALSPEIHLVHVHGRPRVSREFGWIVGDHDDPLVVPVLRMDEWVYLTESGEIIPTDRPTS